jgi:ketosteroid isomerase-like protein
MAPSNAALIKSGYDAFARGDLQGAFAVFAEDILWHIPGPKTSSGRRRSNQKLGEPVEFRSELAERRLKPTASSVYYFSST